MKGFWQEVWLPFWHENGTKVLGWAQAAIPSLIAIDGLIPVGHMKWWLAGQVLLGLGTVVRGHTNSKAAGP